jgi:hypothetical protein
MDTDFGSASPEKGAAYLGMLATDALLAVVAATERLADAAVDGAPPSPDRRGRPWWHARRPEEHRQDQGDPPCVHHVDVGGRLWVEAVTCDASES